MTADISYKKGKRMLNRVVWIVSRYDIPADIMSKDTKTMDRLETEL